jgi:hypothetical protein
MPTAARPSVTTISQLNTEWKSIGRSPSAVDALARVALRDPAMAQLVHGAGDAPPTCPSPYELVEHLRQAGGRHSREEAADLIRVLLREANLHPMVARTLVQALVPGLISVATKLQWGRGGDWNGGDEFFSELLSTTWVTIGEWAGQDRPYAVLDLLSAVRCRLRRQLLRSKQTQLRFVPLHEDELATLTSRPETDLEELTRILIDLRQQGMRADEVQVLYAHHVLGFTISELATVTGRERRALYARRDRGRRRLCA